MDCLFGNSIQYYAAVPGHKVQIRKAPPHRVYFTQLGQTLHEHYHVVTSCSWLQLLCQYSFTPTPDCCGQSFWLNCSVHLTSHMRCSLSNPTGQPNGKDVPRTFSRSSSDSGVQVTGSNCHIWSLPQPGTYHLGQEGERSRRCTKHIFSQNKLCLTTYTHILCKKN